MATRNVVVAIDNSRVRARGPHLRARCRQGHGAVAGRPRSVTPYHTPDLHHPHSPVPCTPTPQQTHPHPHPQHPLQDSWRAVKWTLQNLYRPGDVLHLVHVIPPEEKLMVPIMPSALPFSSTDSFDEMQETMHSYVHRFIDANFLPLAAEHSALCEVMMMMIRRRRRCTTGLRRLRPGMSRPARCSPASRSAPPTHTPQPSTPPPLLPLVTRLTWCRAAATLRWRTPSARSVTRWTPRWWW
jgi:hypothetical protein